MSKASDMKTVLDQVTIEYVDASSRFPAMRSSHEGYAIMLEEVDELWNEVKQNPHKAPGAIQGDPEYNLAKRRERMRAEAIQVAAMAIRFIVDCT